MGTGRTPQRWGLRAQRKGAASLTPCLRLVASSQRFLTLATATDPAAMESNLRDWQAEGVLQALDNCDLAVAQGHPLRHAGRVLHSSVCRAGGVREEPRSVAARRLWRRTCNGPAHLRTPYSGPLTDDAFCARHNPVSFHLPSTRTQCIAILHGPHRINHVSRLTE